MGVGRKAKKNARSARFQGSVKEVRASSIEMTVARAQPQSALSPSLV